MSSRIPFPYRNSTSGTGAKESSPGLIKSQHYVCLKKQS